MASAWRSPRASLVRPLPAIPGGPSRPAHRVAGDPAGPLRVTVAGPGAARLPPHPLRPRTAPARSPTSTAFRCLLRRRRRDRGRAGGALAGGPWGGQVVSLAAPSAGRALRDLRGPPRHPRWCRRPAPPSPAGPPAGERGRRGDRPRRPQGRRPHGRPAALQLPCEAEVDLGRRVRPQILQGVAYDAAGKELARDCGAPQRSNRGLPGAHRRAAPERGVGPVDVEADVRPPRGPADGEGGDLLERRAGRHPLRAAVPPPRDGAAGPPAWATCGSPPGSTTAPRPRTPCPSTPPASATRIDVRLVELAVVVTDDAGRPVPDLAEGVVPRPPGRPATQEISAFENAGELPAHPGPRHRLLGEHVPQAARTSRKARLRPPRQRPHRPRPRPPGRLRHRAPRLLRAVTRDLARRLRGPGQL